MHREASRRPPAIAVFALLVLLQGLLVAAVHHRPLPPSPSRRFLATTLSGGGASSPSPEVLRVRLPDGSTRRVKVEAADTVADVLARAVGGEGKSAGTLPPVFLDQRFQQPLEGHGATVATLGLENGAMLYCKRSAPSTTGSSSGGAAKTPVGGGGADVFAERQRQGKAATSGQRDWEQLSKEQGAGLRVERQAKPNCTKLSLDRATSQRLAVYFAERGRAAAAAAPGDDAEEGTGGGGGGKPSPSGPLCRVALLFGRSESATEAKGGFSGGGGGGGGGGSDEGGGLQVRVDALWEPPQGGATSDEYDAAALLRALGASTTPSAGVGGGGGSSSCNAVKVARALGYRPVGWLFSHGPRDHCLSASDLAVTAALGRAVADAAEPTDDDAAAAATAAAATAAAGKGKKAGKGTSAAAKRRAKAAAAAKASSEFVVVAVRDEALPSIATGEGKAGVGASPSAKKGARKGEEEKEAVSFEAYQISNQAFSWFKDGTLADATAAGADDAALVPTTKPVVADGKSVRSVDAALFTVPVPIVAHDGPLRAAFPPPNRPPPLAGDPNAPRPNARWLKFALFRGSEPLEPRLADFALLLYLHKRLPSIEPLVECALGGAKKDLPPYYRTLLEELVESVP